jgi:hypothetical protein
MINICNVKLLDFDTGGNRRFGSFADLANRGGVVEHIVYEGKKLFGATDFLAMDAVGKAVPLNTHVSVNP